MREQIQLLAAFVCLAMAVPVALHPRRQALHKSFVFFAASAAAWYFTTFGQVFWQPASFWTRFNLMTAAILPLSAARFFSEFSGGSFRLAYRLRQVVWLGGFWVVVIGITPWYQYYAFRVALFVYVTVVLFASLGVMWVQSYQVPSRVDRSRMRYWVVVGALAALFTVLDYLPYLGLRMPAVGTTFTLLFLFVMSQSILRERLLDVYELTGRLAVLSALSFALAFIVWLLVTFTRQNFYLHAVIAVWIVLLVSDPLRLRVERAISEIIFRERHSFSSSLWQLRQTLSHTLEADELVQVTLQSLQSSRRVTEASVYLLDESGRYFVRKGHIGTEPIERLEWVPGRPLLDVLSTEGFVEREDQLALDSEGLERQTILDALQADLCLGFRHGNQVYGFLCVRDERVQDAFSREEIELLNGVASQSTVALENTRMVKRMKERDRLVAMGEVAAGIAHEIRNPLGAIKASAQYLLSDPQADAQTNKEFLDIIVSETDRLNRVVGSFLDLARPETRVQTGPIDLNEAIQKAFQLLGAECEMHKVEWALSLEENLPKVNIDVEHVRQVLINLVQNAIQAMGSGGRLWIETESRRPMAQWIQLRVRDSGPGIAQEVLRKLFMPFVTTKEKGTGLGLAICQKLITEAGGFIQAVNHVPHGTTFIIDLPVAHQATGEMPSETTSNR